MYEVKIPRGSNPSAPRIVPLATWARGQATAVIDYGMV
jgi:hypothetical protein